MKRFLWLLFIVFCFVVSTACGVSQSAAIDSAIANGQSPVTVPFDLIDNRIVINVKLDGKGPFRFIFDSGAGAVASPEVVRSLGLKIENLQRGGGGGGEQLVERGETTIPAVEVGEIRLPAQEFGVLSFADTKYVFGT